LLAETGVGDGRNESVSINASGAEAAADWNDLKSGENYLGYERTENFASEGATQDKHRVYSAPARLRLNQWTLSGNWTMGREAIVLNQPNGRITYQFHARDLHLVLGPRPGGKPIRFRVLIDGARRGMLTALM
jgi:hypothetical protein